MKKIIIGLLVIIISPFILQAEDNYMKLKELIKSEDYINTGKLLRTIIHRDDVPDVKPWLKCGDIYYETGKLYSALYFYSTALVKFEFVTDIFEPEELGINEKEMEKEIKTKIDKLYKALNLNVKKPFFDPENENEMPDNDFYQYLAETAKIKNEIAAGLLPAPYAISDLAATIEDHLEESADSEMGPDIENPEGTGEEEGEFEEGEEGEYDEGEEGEGEEGEEYEEGEEGEEGEDEGEEVVETPKEHYPSPDEEIEVDEDPAIDLNKLIGKIVYPADAKKRKIEGVVIVNVLVGKNGVPVKCIVIQSDAEILNKAAIDAIMKSKFTPAKLNKKPIACWVDVPVEFKIKGK